jgi:hypothetical protein
MASYVFPKTGVTLFYGAITPTSIGEYALALMSKTIF